MAESLVGTLLKDMPSNWGRWGKEDELGGLNFLTKEEVARGVASITTNKAFALSQVIGNPKGDPVWPGRSGAIKLMTQDKGSYASGKLEALHGGLEYADDYVTMYLQGSTQFDALGHTWYDDKLYNGYDAASTMSGMGKASVLPLAEKTATGHGVLLDMPRFKKKDHLAKGEPITFQDLQDCAKHQHLTIQKHDILLIRTGWLEVFYNQGAATFYEAPFLEPGLVFSPELVQWFHSMEIPLLGTDTIANEITVDPNNGIVLPLHSALMRNLGVVFNEILKLDDLAADCDKDKKYDFLYSAAPLKIARGTGAPVNPVVIK